MTPVPLLLVRFWQVLMLPALLVFFLVFFLTPMLPTGVDVVHTFTVPVPERPPSGQYEYDGYYALQATDLFSDTLSGWLASADFVANVYKIAELPPPASSVRSLSHLFTANKRSGQLVELRFHTDTTEHATRLVDAINKNILERTDTFNAAGQKGLVFHVTTGKPLILSVHHNRLLYALVGALVTCVVFVNSLLLWDAARTPTAS